MRERGVVCTIRNRRIPYIYLREEKEVSILVSETNGPKIRAMYGSGVGLLRVTSRGIQYGGGFVGERYIYARCIAMSLSLAN